MDAQIMSADALRRIFQRGWLAISNFMAESIKRPRATECRSHLFEAMRVEQSPLRPLRGQRRLDGGVGDRPQPRSLDSAHRSGRAGGDHQDPPTTVLLPRRTAHPFGPPPHFASAPALALGNPAQSRPGPIASSATPCLTAAAIGPPTSPPSTNYPNVPQPRARSASERLLLRPVPR